MTFTRHFLDNIQAIALAEDELGADVAVTVSGWGSVSDSECVFLNNITCHYIITFIF